MSPYSSRDGVNFHEAYAVRCQQCGLIAVVPHPEASLEAAQHYANFHPQVALVRQGREYVTEPSPVCCDTCNAPAQLPYWTHISDPPTHVGNMIDSDGRWLVCDICHRLWLARDLDAWIERHWQIFAAQSPGIAHRVGVRARLLPIVAQRMQLLFLNWDSGTRDTAS